MANPQKENGHIEIATEIIEALCGYRLSGEEWQILWVILRKTWGWHKKEDWIPLSQFVELTGLKKPHIIRSINKLIEKGIVTKIGNENGKIYGFNKDYDTWKVLPKKVIVAKKGNTITKIGNDVAKIGNASLPKKVPSIDTSSKDTLSIDTLSKDNVHISREIFDYWNSKKTKINRSFEKIKPHISAALKLYSEEEIKQAIDNYVLIISNPEINKYWWTHKYLLKDFLLKGLERFAPDNFKESDYFKRTYKSKAELDEERSLEILSKIYKEEEAKENDEKGNDNNIGNPKGSI